LCIQFPLLPDYLALLHYVPFGCVNLQHYQRRIPLIPCWEWCASSVGSVWNYQSEKPTKNIPRLYGWYLQSYGTRSSYNNNNPETWNHHRVNQPCTHSSTRRILQNESHYKIPFASLTGIDVEDYNSYRRRFVSEANYDNYCATKRINPL
jgi:hypothetical protein